MAVYATVHIFSRLGGGTVGVGARRGSEAPYLSEDLARPSLRMRWSHWSHHSLTGSQAASGIGMCLPRCSLSACAIQVTSGFVEATDGATG
jgi:hypothetical protein